VDDVSFSVEEAEIFGILGPNGAGKTTTVECIEGLRTPDRGRIRVLGPDPHTGGAELHQQVGVQLQESELPERIQVGEALELYSSFYLFSGGPGGEITLNPHVCPAQKADVSDSSGATGVVQATLDPEQRCVVAAAILYAVAQLGKPYVWGGTGPVGYDCSGLIMMAYRAAGVSLPRTTFQQVYAGTAVYSFSDLMPGDLLFTPGSDGTAEDPGHVGMYVGQGLVIQAPQTGEDIEITPFKGYWQQNVVAVRRVV
jgi:cell wall-associated NlpC family hydrolase